MLQKFMIGLKTSASTPHSLGCSYGYGGQFCCDATFLCARFDLRRLVCVIRFKV